MEKMKLGMTDVQDALWDDKVDDIERMLIRSGSGHNFEAKSTNRTQNRFVDDHDVLLSDGVPLETHFSLTAIGS
jgi:hypothetical protein